MTRCGSAKAPFEEHLFRFYATAAKDLPGDVKPRQASLGFEQIYLLGGKDIFGRS